MMYGISGCPPARISVTSGGRSAVAEVSAPTEENVRWSLRTVRTSSWRVTTQSRSSGA